MQFRPMISPRLPVRRCGQDAGEHRVKLILAEPVYPIGVTTSKNSPGRSGSMALRLTELVIAQARRRVDRQRSAHGSPASGQASGSQNRGNCQEAEWVGWLKSRDQ